MQVVMSLTAIKHYFIMPDTIDEREQTPFQGYHMDLTNPGYKYAFVKTTFYPRDICEIFMSPREVLGARNIGRNNSFYFISISEFLKFSQHIDDVFFTVSYLSSNHELIAKAIELCKYKPITVSDGKQADFCFDDIDGPMVFDKVLKKKLADYSQTVGDYQGILKALNKKKLRKKDSRRLNYPLVSHNITNPTNSLLISCGYQFSGTKIINPKSSKEKYIDEIVSITKLALKLQKEDKSIHQSDLVVYSPAIYSYLYDMNSHFWNSILRTIKDKDIKVFLKNGILKNPHYSGFTLEVKDGFLENLKKCDTARYIIYTRQVELMITTCAVTLQAISNNSPAVRLPNSVNFYAKEFKELERLSHSDDKKIQTSFKNKFTKIVSDIKSDIGDALSDLISEKTKSLSICCDAPLEWIPFKKIPLMFTHEISRINITPGNKFLIDCSFCEIVRVNKSDLCDILIIRSFKDEDPIKFHFEKALKIYNYDNINITFIDVQSRADLVDALNKYKGVLVVFDCHGNHDGNMSNGWLNIGDEKVDTWGLYKEANVPPIVILSACLTSAVSGSHASVANGLLRSGAISVIGSFLSVNSIKSVSFVARILWRISKYLDILKDINVKEITWRRIISDFFKMAYVQDILFSLATEMDMLTMKQFEELSIKSNYNINTFRENWFDLMVADVSEICGLTPDDVEKIILSELVIVESMYYQQLGKPENITIILD